MLELAVDHSGKGRSHATVDEHHHHYHRHYHQHEEHHHHYHCAVAELGVPSFLALRVFGENQRWEETARDYESKSSI